MYPRRSQVHAKGGLTNLHTEALPRPLNGMNAELMRDYVEYVADFILTELGYPVHYGKANPFQGFVGYYMMHPMTCGRLQCALQQHTLHALGLGASNPVRCARPP